MTTFTSAVSFINVPENNYDQVSSIDRNWDVHDPDTTPTSSASIAPMNNTVPSLLSEPFTDNSNNAKRDHQQIGCDYNDRGGLSLFVIHVLVVLAISIYYISSMTRLRHDNIFLQQYDEAHVHEYWDNMIPYFESWYLIVILFVPCLIIVCMTFLLDCRTCKTFLKGLTILDMILFIGALLYSIITLQFQYSVICQLQARTLFSIWGRIPFLSTMIDVATSLIQSQNVEVLAFYSYFYLSLFYLWLYLLWKTSVAAYYVHNSNPDDIDNAVQSLFIVFFLSSLWMFRVLQNVTRIMTANIVGSLCLPSVSAVTVISLPTQVHALHQRSVSKLFGTICAGILNDLVEFIKVGCCCRLHGAIFSQWVFIFVGMDGSSYRDSERNARTLFQTNGWNLFTADYLYNVELPMIGTIIGYMSLFCIVFMKFVLDPPNSDDNMVLIPFAALIFGYTMTMTVFTIIETIARTVIICYYRSPHEFQTSYPQLYQRMTEILPRRSSVMSSTVTDPTDNDGAELA